MGVSILSILFFFLFFTLFVVVLVYHVIILSTRRAIRGYERYEYAIERIVVLATIAIFDGVTRLLNGIVHAGLFRGL